jgi:hypothetical protein
VAAFDAKGTVSGGVDPGTSILGLFFSRTVVPCPEEPGGVAQKTIAAPLKFADNRLRGDYIVGGCPGGGIDLLRN